MWQGQLLATGLIYTRQIYCIELNCYFLLELALKYEIESIVEKCLSFMVFMVKEKMENDVLTMLIYRQKYHLKTRTLAGIDEAQHLVETGVWLHHFVVLSASPDGLVGEDSVLEAKCPYTHRDLTIEEAIKTSNFYLEKKDGEIVLKRDHVYWHQVQGHLFLTKRKKCYFVVWTLKDFVVLEIQRDDSWEIKIEELKEFYLKHLFPKIIEGKL